MSSLSLARGEVLTLSLPPAGRPEMEIAATVRWSQGPLLGLEFKSNSEAAYKTEQENDVDRLFRLLEELRLFLLSGIPSTPEPQKRPSWNDVWRVSSYVIGTSTTRPQKVS